MKLSNYYENIAYIFRYQEEYNSVLEPAGYNLFEFLDTPTITFDAFDQEKHKKYITLLSSKILNAFRESETFRKIFDYEHIEELSIVSALQNTETYNLILNKVVELNIETKSTTKSKKRQSSSVVSNHQGFGTSPKHISNTISIKQVIPNDESADELDWKTFEIYINKVLKFTYQLDSDENVVYVYDTDNELLYPEDYNEEDTELDSVIVDKIKAEFYNEEFTTPKSITVPINGFYKTAEITDITSSSTNTEKEFSVQFGNTDIVFVFENYELIHIYDGNNPDKHYNPSKLNLSFDGNKLRTFYDFIVNDFLADYIIKDYLAYFKYNSNVSKWFESLETSATWEDVEKIVTFDWIKNLSEYIDDLPIVDENYFELISDVIISQLEMMPQFSNSLLEYNFETLEQDLYKITEVKENIPFVRKFEIRVSDLPEESLYVSLKNGKIISILSYTGKLLDLSRYGIKQKDIENLQKEITNVFYLSDDGSSERAAWASMDR